MGPLLLSLLGALVSAVVPILVNWIKNKIPAVNPATGVAFTATELRSTARQWVVDLLAEVGNALVSKGVVPKWLTPELPLLEQLVAQAVDTALDQAGL